MSERKMRLIGLVLMSIGFSGLFSSWVGIRQGRAEMKLWQDSYYAAHDTHGHWLYPCPFTEGCVMISTSEWSSLVKKGEGGIILSVPDSTHFIYTKPAPVPPAKPAKGSKRPHFYKSFSYDDMKCHAGSSSGPVVPCFVPPAQPIPEAIKQGCYRMDEMCGNLVDMPLPEKEPRQLTINSPTVDWVVKLEPCEGGIYRFHRNTGIIECEPSVPAGKP